MSDPWAQRLVVVGVIVVWLVSMTMAYQGGWAGAVVSGYEERDSLVVAAMSSEADRIQAGREAWVRCRKTDTPPACEFQYLESGK